MKKWFYQLTVGEVIAEPKLKGEYGKPAHFDYNDLDYFKIVRIVKTSLYTINLATNAPLEFVGAGCCDDFFKEPCFEVVTGNAEIRKAPAPPQYRQLSIFDL